MKVAVGTAKLLRSVPLPDEIATVHTSAVVVDLGSGSTRIGFSGDDAPRLVAPTVWSVDSEAPGDASGGGVAPGGAHFLADAHRHRGGAPVRRILDRGVVTDWDGVERLFQHIYGVLDLKHDQTAPVLITESALAPKEQRERLTEILFESVGLQSIYFQSAPVGAMFSSGATTGVTVEMGHGSCHTAPVFEGFPLFHAILQLDIGGSDLTAAIAQAIQARGGASSAALGGESDREEIAQFLKERYAQVCADKGDFAIKVSDSRKDDVVEHTLPDGSVVTLGHERFRAPETLFDPAVLGDIAPGNSGTVEPRVTSTGGPLRGIHHLCVESIRKCDLDIAPALLSNVVLAGGSSLFPGLPARLHAGIRELYPDPERKVKVDDQPERRHAAWVGASIFASLPTVQELWVRRSDYDECGDRVKGSIAHRNCF